MKKTIVVTVSTIAILAAFAAIAWNIVIVVDTYQEPRQHKEHYGQNLDRRMYNRVEWSHLQAEASKEKSTQSRTVVIKSRPLTGETWKEYLD